MLLTLFSAGVLFAQGVIANEEKVTCVTVSIQCANGGGTNLVTCGTPQQILEDIAVVMAVTCK